MIFSSSVVADSGTAYVDQRSSRAVVLNLDAGLSRHDEEWGDATKAMRKQGFYLDAAYFDYDSNVAYGLRNNLGKFLIDNDMEWQGGWPLTRWEEFYLEEEAKERYTSYGQSLSDPSVARAFGDERVGDYMGCIPATPLRYGDVTGNGESELVVITSGDLIVFSPDREGTVFSSRLLVSDTISRERTKYLIEGGGRPYGDRPQYTSRLLENATEGRTDHFLAGYRGHAKLFIGDFNDDGLRDIIEWRKLYQSRELDDPVDGFELKREVLLHHRFEEGLAHTQGTEEEEIRVWLDDQGLTWAHGWPSSSECEGEEGKLIKEWHDPLLNDPDVLEGVDPETMTLVEDEEH